MFDTARPGQYCFNLKHTHHPVALGTILDAIMRKTKDMQRRWDPRSTFGGEHIYDAATEYWDYSWTWRPLGHDDLAAWRMAFPQARNAALVADVRESNKAFSAGFLLNLLVDSGRGWLNDHPALATHLRKLSRVKKEFAGFLNDGEYLHNMSCDIKGADRENAWVQLYRLNGEALLFLCDYKGQACRIDLRVDLGKLLGKGTFQADIYDVNLTKTASVTAEGVLDISEDIPADSLVMVKVHRSTLMATQNPPPVAT